MKQTDAFSKEFLEKIKNELETRRAQIKEQLSNFASVDPKQKDNYSSDYPDFGEKEDENAAEVVAFESNLSLEETLEQSLEMISYSMKKLDSGTYGLCEKCGQPIDERHLEIMPTATKCSPAQCKAKHD